MKRTMAVMGMVVLLGSASANGEQTVPRGTEGAQVWQAGGGEQGGHRKGPPPEAYAACKGKTAGATAQFTNPEGEVVAGTCRVADGRLVLRPTNPKGNGREGRHGPPPEAYKACEGKKAGGMSQFVDPRGEKVKGTCEEEDGKMVLRPVRNKVDRQGQATGGSEEDRGAR